ncbi:MAG: DUF5660 domain-containing protein [Candidatus Woesebacteria bacterium]|jgi:hypothetical protein
MNQLGQKLNTSSKKKTKANPFAKALAEREKSAYSQKQKSNDLLGETLAKGGSSFLDNNFSPRQPDKYEEQEAEKKAKKEALRKKLHEKVNPVEQTEIYNARQKRVKDEINKLSDELKFLAQDVAKFNKEVELTLMTEVVDPGQDGQYYINFFQKLRAFIMFLRQKIRSARTWATQMHAKSKKKKKKKGRRIGLDFAGNEAKAAHDALHHERYNAYSGG